MHIVKIGLFLLAFLAPGQAFASSEEPIFGLDLQRLIVPVQFPLDRAENMPPGSLQSRFIQITGALRHTCMPKSTVLACAWPAVVDEINITGSALRPDSPGPDKLALTLASRIHHIDLLNYSNSSIPFDQAYARFLMALRMARELWPSVKQSIPELGLKSETADVFIEPWLTTLTPWSMMYQLILSRVCSWQRGAPCMHNVDLVTPVSEVMRRIRADREFMQALQVQLLSLRHNQEIMADRRSSLLDKKLTELVEAVLNNKPSGYLFERTSYLHTSLTVDQIFHYLSDDVRTMAAPPQVRDYTPRGDQCLDSRQVLSYLQEEATISWSREAPKLSCANEQASEDEVDALMTWLKQKGKLQAFNLFHVRLVLMNVFEPAANTDSKTLRLAQLQRLLTDVNDVWDNIDKYYKNANNPDQIKGREMMRMIYNFLYELVEGQLSGASK